VGANSAQYHVLEGSAAHPHMLELEIVAGGSRQSIPNTWQKQHATTDIASGDLKNTHCGIETTSGHTIDEICGLVLNQSKMNEYSLFNLSLIQPRLWQVLGP
jgi:hypothetical protein